MYSLMHPEDMANTISGKARGRRLELNITQKELAEKSGVSLGSVKRFEASGEISIKHLLKIAVVLRAIDGFETLFNSDAARSVDDVIKRKRGIRRKRARKSDS